jgi:hypothetical protein
MHIFRKAFAQCYRPHGRHLKCSAKGSAAGPSRCAAVQRWKTTEQGCLIKKYLWAVSLLAAACSTWPAAACAASAKVIVSRYAAVGDGVTDDTAAIQRAHDALPATGGTIYFPRTDSCYLLAVNGTYVTISKPNVSLVGDAGAWVCSPDSADAEKKSGAPYLNGFVIRGNDAVVSINLRGPALAWTSGSATDRLTVRNMEFRNLYNAGIAINKTAFGELNVDNVFFNTSRDLTSDPGNYHAISRGAASTDGPGRLIRVTRSVFRATSGGIDAHNVRNLVVEGGTRFEGCDFVCIKLATLDNGRVEQNLSVDGTVTFDGTPANAASRNRHLSAARGAGAKPGTMYLGFIQVFSDVRFRGTARNYPHNGLTFLDGMFTGATLDLDRSQWENSPAAIVDPQGTITLRGATLKTSNLVFTAVGTPRRMTISNNRLIDSVINITKRASAPGDLFEVVDNDITYGIDDAGPIRFVDYGTDSGPALVIDRNRITLSKGRSVAMDLGSAGTQAYVGRANTYGQGLIKGRARALEEWRAVRVPVGVAQ